MPPHRAILPLGALRQTHHSRHLHLHPFFLSPSSSIAPYTTSNDPSTAMMTLSRLSPAAVVSRCKQLHINARGSTELLLLRLRAVEQLQQGGEVWHLLGTEDLTSWVTVKWLKEELGRRGLSKASGNKRELADRLLEYQLGRVPKLDESLLRATRPVVTEDETVKIGVAETKKEDQSERERQVAKMSEEKDEVQLVDTEPVLEEEEVVVTPAAGFTEELRVLPPAARDFMDRLLEAFPFAIR